VDGDVNEANVIEKCTELSMQSKTKPAGLFSITIGLTNQVQTFLIECFVFLSLDHQILALTIL
jgi:hypothetical protein